jgi:hypothetical protein
LLAACFFFATFFLAMDPSLPNRYRSHNPAFRASGHHQIAPSRTPLAHPIEIWVRPVLPFNLPLARSIAYPIAL